MKKKNKKKNYPFDLSKGKKLKSTGKLEELAVNLSVEEIELATG